ncbi:MAG: dephospho-CoA kinase [Clostridiales bacterium]|nr:dephospho-CoA kinase [Clostridiales bacterium]
MTPNKPRLIGLTGGIACGKSSLTKALRAHGAVVIDADAIAHELTAPGSQALPRLQERFGADIVEEGQLNRQRLGELVFSDAAALRDLNTILHPLIFERMDRQISEHGDQRALVADVPLLYETGYDRQCDEVWCAWAPRTAQLERLLERGLTEDQAWQRINSQMDAMDKARRADRVIITTGSLKDNARAVQRLWDEMIRRTQDV